MPTARAWLRTIAPIGEEFSPPTQPVRNPSRESAYETFVLPAPDPHFQHRRELDAPMLWWRQADHALTEADQIEAAIFGVANLHVDGLPEKFCAANLERASSGLQVSL
jgi:hypothetical protein